MISRSHLAQICSFTINEGFYWVGLFEAEELAGISLLAPFAHLTSRFDYGK